MWKVEVQYLMGDDKWWIDHDECRLYSSRNSAALYARSVAGVDCRALLFELVETIEVKA